MEKHSDTVHKDELSVVLCGAAGQGIKTIETMLTHILKEQGYYVFATMEYESRIRGGCNSTEIRVSQQPVAAYVERIDLLIPLSEKALAHLENRIGDGTLIAGPPAILAKAQQQDLAPANQCFEIEYTQIAKDAGKKLYANSVAAGMVFGILGIAEDRVGKSIKARFSNKDADVQQGNADAALAGRQQGRRLIDGNFMAVKISPQDESGSDLLLTGAQAVGLGAIAGGCNFVGSYPMSPSTGVLVFMAEHADKFGIAVEQAEDEIAAINMGLGAWFAGARAMATTSGGGFALMCEGMSLAGMIESPMVVHLAQRPGPATGLPTRTEQGDLEMAVYAGHGEFARIVLAPGSPEQAFDMTRRAFELADSLQVPVVILTDQFLMDSYCNVSGLGLPDHAPENHIVETGADYRRYEIAANGLSPRGIPGYGKGLVSLDSDEHDEGGHITEDLDLRHRMLEKRLKRFALIEEAAIAPQRFGRQDAPNLLIAWGSTLNVAREAVRRTGRDDIALLHFQQVFPIPPDTKETLANHKRVVVVENNATGQFAKLLKLHADADVDGVIAKYSGMPFSVEEIERALQQKFPEEG